MDRSHDERAFCPVDMIHQTLGPRKERPFLHDVLLRSLAHDPRQRHLLFLSDRFEGFVNVGRETYRCAHGRYWIGFGPHAFWGFVPWLHFWCRVRSSPYFTTTVNQTQPRFGNWRRDLAVHPSLTK